MNAHMIKNGVVINTVVVRSLADLPDLVDASAGGAIGDLYANGVFSKPQPTPPVVPDTAPMAAARKALRAAGIKDAQVKGIINGSAMTAEQKEDALIDWEYQPVIRRHSPLVAAFGPALGLTEAQIDILFITAAAIAAA